MRCQRVGTTRVDVLRRRQRRCPLTKASHNRARMTRRMFLIVAKTKQRATAASRVLYGAKLRLNNWPFTWKLPRKATMTSTSFSGNRI